jgi:hypothetical protein
MHNQQKVGAALARGSTFLRKNQAEDGGFDTFYSPSVQPFRAQAPYRTTFLPALILQALGGVNGTNAVRNRLAQWLIAQRSPQWSFNYWPAGAKERSEMTYPDDLDDTFCALGGLWRHDSKLVGPDVMGKAVRILLAAETNVGGPYRTWIVPPTANAVWLDVDLAVNTNIAYFLRLVAQPLPALDTLMERAVAAKKFTSPYYPSAWPLMYYIGRAYRGAKSAALTRQVQLLKTEDGHWDTPLHTALALSILHEQNDDSDVSAAISYLLRTQQPDGSWPAEPFWLEVKQTYSGSPALTTALVLEALARCQNPRAKMPVNVHREDRQATAIYNTVIASAKTAAHALPPDLRAPANAALTRMVRSSTNREIVLLPYFFARSLAMGTTDAAEAYRVPKALLEKLGLANMHGWAAYTMYDDLLDSGGDIRTLPLANTYMRLSLYGFLDAVPGAPSYQAIVRNIFNRIDAANTWEVTNCRFVVGSRNVHIAQLPHYNGYKQLAERSLGHALPAMAVLAHQSILPTDPRARLLLSGLTHYLIARQLGDDTKDWEADLRAGQCSAVVTQLLAACGITSGTYRLEPLVKRTRHAFAAQVLQEVSEDILRHANLATRYLQKSDLVRSRSPITQLSEDIAELAEQQLQECVDARTFLAAYKNS